MMYKRLRKVPEKKRVYETGFSRLYCDCVRQIKKKVENLEGRHCLLDKSQLNDTLEFFRPLKVVLDPVILSPTEHLAKRIIEIRMSFCPMCGQRIEEYPFLDPEQMRKDYPVYTRPDPVKLSPLTIENP